ncbi:deoxyhypusine synthase [Candidatus Woesearchaeota archaeon]|nr:MAG: deoxyhypusine synthase [Candidatus Woesearchaeota archaeon]
MNEKHAQFNDVRTVADLSTLKEIRGPDFERLNLDELLKGYAGMGFQGSNLAKAIDIINIMRREHAFIFFGFTSNMVSCGLRESITFLAKHQLVRCMVTACGGIDEDLLKCWGSFRLGEFDAKGEVLFENGVNRIGNIFVANDQFVPLDKFMRKVLAHVYEQYTKQGRVVTSRVITRELGLAINNEESFLYWAAKHDIPVLVPALMDGSFGDLCHFFRQQHPDFHIDVTEDMDFMVKTALNNDPVGAILLGAGTVKHYILNTNIFREGVDYAVYINTSDGFDGSDSGGNIEEAITWGKVKPRSPRVKVRCDASIAWPLIMAGSFAKHAKPEEHSVPE